MNEYVMLYRRSKEISREAMGTPERAQRTMKLWQAWFEEMTDKGQLKSVGQPWEERGKVVWGRKKTVTDGLYDETKDIIGGYVLIEAEDLDAAAHVAAGCPILEAGGCVEVRPVRQMNL